METPTQTPRRFSLRKAANFFKDTRDDDPPSMKRYCNVSNTFPKVMPSEEDARVSSRNSSTGSAVRYVPIRLEDPIESPFDIRLNSSKHSSPLPSEKNESPNLVACARTASCTCKKNCALHDRTNDGRPEPPERTARSFYRRSNDRIFAKKAIVYGINSEDEDDFDDEVEYVGTIRNRNRIEDDAIALPDDNGYYKYIKLRSPERNPLDTSRKKPELIEILDEDEVEERRTNKISKRRPSYLHSPFKTRLSSIMKPKLFSLRPHNGRRAYEGVTKSFNMEERRKLADLIHKMSEPKNVSGANGAPFEKGPSRNDRRGKNEVIDLTAVPFPERYSEYKNGELKKNDAKENSFKKPSAENPERADVETVNSADESSTTSSERIRPLNPLRRIVTNNPFANPNWIEEISKRYETISLKKENEVIRIEEESDAEELPCLTDEQEAMIDAALKNRNPNEVLIEKFNLSIHRRDVHSLSGLNWLNDEVINFYMNLIMERSTNGKLPKVYGMNTFFYPKLMQSGHAGLKRWTRKVDIFSYDIILVPVHLGVHWCMCIVNLKEKTIKYYDSMGGQNRQCCDALLKYLEDEMADKKKQKFNREGWVLQCVKDIPQQMNGSDCGMFSCMFAEYTSRNAEITFSQADMPYFRRKMVLEIIQGQLLT